jgi:hypothetical protein
MADSHMADSDMSAIKAPSSRKAFEKFIEFVSTGFIKVDYKFTDLMDSVELLNIASMYETEDLRQLIEQHLLAAVCPASVETVFEISLDFGLNLL